MISNQPLDSRQLRAFVTVAHTLNMRQAARELHLTPSAISHALKALESELGCALLERSSRRITITQAGAQFLPEVEAVLDQMESARLRLSEWTDWRQGQIRIGASATACQYILPAVLREFKECFPGYNIKIESGNARALSDLLDSRKIDFALSPIYRERPNQEATVIGEDELSFLIHPLHPWARRNKVDRDQIESQKFILTGSPSLTYDLIRDFFQRENIAIQPFIEINNEEVIKELVRLDIGIGIFPNWIAADEIENGLLRTLPLGERSLRRQWSIARSTQSELTFAENVFHGICRSVSQNLIAC